MRILRASGPFDFDETLDYLSGFAAAGIAGPVDAYRVAHVIEGRPLLVEVTARDGALALELTGGDVVDADYEAAGRLVRRVFSLDWDGDDFYGRIGQEDPVLGEVQQRRFGLRPVLFATPFEALCWAIISQRVNYTQALNLRKRLAGLGLTLLAGGREYRAFPPPEAILAAGSLTMPLSKVEWLRALAERAAGGELEADRLLGMPPDEARAWLLRSPGIGTWASEFALIRGVGFPDLLPSSEQRFRTAIRSLYGLGTEPGEAELSRIGRAWVPYRSWAAFLLRVVWQAEERERAEAERQLWPARRRSVPGSRTRRS